MQHRLARTVSVGQSTSNCGHTPRERRIASISLSTLRPSTYAEPAVLRSSPVSMLMVVVLPAPLCPSRLVICIGVCSRHARALLSE